MKKKLFIINKISFIFARNNTKSSIKSNLNSMILVARIPTSKELAYGKRVYTFSYFPL